MPDIFDAVEAGDLTRVQQLLDASPDLVNAVESHGATPLHLAAFAGQDEVARVLLSRGANVSARTHDGATPLHDAARRNRSAVAAMLLAHGAQADARTQAGRTPLHAAAYFGHQEMVELLFTHGANLNAGDNEGVTPLHMAADQARVEIVRWLLANGAQPNAKNRTDGWTPLHSAVAAGALETVEALLANGADVNARDKHGRTPLHNAARCGHRAVVEVLLAHGADINIRDERGATPLEWAGGQKHMDIVALLRSHREIARKQDRTPLEEEAAQSGVKPIDILLTSSRRTERQPGSGVTSARRRPQGPDERAFAAFKPVATFLAWIIFSVALLWGYVPLLIWLPVAAAGAFYVAGAPTQEKYGPWHPVLTCIGAAGLATALFTSALKMPVRIEGALQLRGALFLSLFFVYLGMLVGGYFTMGGAGRQWLKTFILACLLGTGVAMVLSGQTGGLAAVAIGILWLALRASRRFRQP